MDKTQYIDYTDSTSFGVIKLAQFKVRVSGHDLGIAYREPFCKFVDRAYNYFLPADLLEPHDGDKPGRDMEGKYHYFVCLAPDEKVIRIANANVIKPMVQAVIDRWLESDFKVYSGNPFAHPEYPGVQIRHVVDQGKDRSGRSRRYPKIIVYVRPEILADGKEIIYIPYQKS